MPELAEVEYYRRRWDPGLGGRVVSVQLHAQRRIFRQVDAGALEEAVYGATFLDSRAHGKWMLFHFGRQRQSRHAWVGVHLGMTGELRCEAAKYQPGRHDHLVLFQARRALIFHDPRQFGRVTFHESAGVPDWWKSLPPALSSCAFTPELVEKVLSRRRASPVKAVLLMQDAFPGIGNWMADEILWRARLHPAARAGDVAHYASRVWKEVKSVAAGALRIVSRDFGDPPKSWLFPHRWRPGGKCPRDRTPLQRGMVGGRTTVWCGKCQSTKK
jgi:formamidopyrimidine-DNA glycosylase